MGKRTTKIPTKIPTSGELAAGRILRWLRTGTQHPGDLKRLTQEQIYAEWQEAERCFRKSSVGGSFKIASDCRRKVSGWERGAQLALQQMEIIEISYRLRKGVLSKIVEAPSEPLGLLKSHPNVPIEQARALLNEWFDRIVSSEPRTADVRTAAADVATIDTPKKPEDMLPPAPPAFHVVKSFTQGHDFVGRKQELERINRWARGPNPLLVFEAIGGMGKSTLTYRWMDRVAPGVCGDLAGRLWYSFYEDGADMNDFCIQALSYIEQRPARDFLGEGVAKLEPRLLWHLRERPWLIAMDGIERVLVQYHRFDKAELRDGEAIADPNKRGRNPLRCVKPEDDHLLQALATASRSKLLVSTRNVPAVLVNTSGGSIAGVELEPLTGLEPEDAERMMRAGGIGGNSRRMRDYLERHFECHPLMVGIVAGLINTYLPAPGAFDRWEGDADAAGAVDLTTLDGLVRKQDHILKIAYETLEPDMRKLLCILAYFPQAISSDALKDLNPRCPPRPPEVMKPHPFDAKAFDLSMKEALKERATPRVKAQMQKEFQQFREHEAARFELQRGQYLEYQTKLEQWGASRESKIALAWLQTAVTGLKSRGLILIISDRVTGRYDLHPMVRSFVRHTLKGDESAATGRAVADYARSKSNGTYADAASLADLTPGIEIVTALTLGGHLSEAAHALSTLVEPLLRLGLTEQFLELAQPFFPQGWHCLPDGSDEIKLMFAFAASLSFSLRGDLPRGETLLRLVVARAVAEEDLGALTALVRGYAMLVMGMRCLVRAVRLLTLHKELATLTGDENEATAQIISRARLDLYRGELASAQSGFRSLKELMATRDTEEHGELPAGVQFEIAMLELELLMRTKSIKESDIERAFAHARAERYQIFERFLFIVRGMFLQWKGEHERAIEAFQQAIAMAREAFSPMPAPEARYAISLVAVGRRKEALEIARDLQASDNPPHVDLAQLFLALDDKGMAHRHAVEGFRWAWADGPPFAFHWRLEECRKVLKALDKPEPALSPFDPGRAELPDFEPDLRRLIEKKKAERKPLSHPQTFH